MYFDGAKNKTSRFGRFFEISRGSSNAIFLGSVKTKKKVQKITNRIAHSRQNSAKPFPLQKQKICCIIYTCQMPWVGQTYKLAKA